MTSRIGRGAWVPAAVGFGAELRRLREARGMSSTALNRALNPDALSRSTGAVSRIESGSRNVGRDTAIAICDVLGLVGYEREHLLNLAGYTEVVWSEDAWQAERASRLDGAA